jgi:hypothetical protein
VRAEPAPTGDGLLMKIHVAGISSDSARGISTMPSALLFSARDVGHSLDTSWTPLKICSENATNCRQLHVMRDGLFEYPPLSQRGYSQLSPFPLNRAHRFVFFLICQGAMP